MRKLFPLLILVMVLIMSCEEPEVNPFIGTWEGNWTGQTHVGQLVFTETIVIFTVLTIPDSPLNFERPYTHDNIHLIIHGENIIDIFHYIINDNVLIIDGGSFPQKLNKIIN